LTQVSTLPENIRAIFDRLDASTVTSDQLATAIKDAKALVPKSDAQTALDAALNDPGTQAAVSTEVSRLIDLQTDAYNELKAQGQDRRDIGTSASQAAATLAAILRELKDEINAVRQSVVDLASAPAVTRA
jgi:chromosome segregation ATPase